ncbi:MAG: CopD family protein [Polyangiales bacterium]
MRYVTTPSMIVAFAGGLGMLLPNFTALYAKAGWMHAKLLFVVLFAGVTGALSASLRKPEQSRRAAEKKMALLIAVFVVVIASLAVLKPGA